MDPRRLICPRPTPPILLRGCNINGCSLLPVLPTGLLAGSAMLDGFSTRRPLGANTFWTHAPPRHNGWRLQQPSSYGFAAAASTSGLPARLHGDSNARQLSHVCNSSMTAACAQCSRRNSVDRQLQCEQRLWPTRT
jgi:hypothetical protein